MTQALSKKTAAGLAKYNPAKGVQTIAFLEGAEKAYAKAKDAKKLELAIRAKLEAQAEFVFWWDTQADKAKRGQPKKNSNGSERILSRLGKDGLPDPVTVSRWRKKLNQADDFEATFRKALDRYIKILEMRTGATAGMVYPESNEWYTPEKYIEAARAVMGGIDLDPASNPLANKTVQAKKFYTAENTGLQYEWEGRVWLNPPYSGNASEFVRRLGEQVKAGLVSQAVVLVNAHSTDTSWFEPLWDALLCFTNHRINFVSPASGAQSGSNHGSVFAYFGPNRDQFIEQFSAFGVVVERVPCR